MAFFFGVTPIFVLPELNKTAADNQGRFFQAYDIPVECCQTNSIKALKRRKIAYCHYLLIIYKLTSEELYAAHFMLALKKLYAENRNESYINDCQAIRLQLWSHLGDLSSNRQKHVATEIPCHILTTCAILSSNVIKINYS